MAPSISLCWFSSGIPSKSSHSDFEQFFLIITHSSFPSTVVPVMEPLNPLSYASLPSLSPWQTFTNAWCGHGFLISFPSKSLFHFDCPSLIPGNSYSADPWACWGSGHSLSQGLSLCCTPLFVFPLKNVCKRIRLAGSLSGVCNLVTENHIMSHYNLYVNYVSIPFPLIKGRTLQLSTK